MTRRISLPLSLLAIIMLLGFLSTCTKKAEFVNPPTKLKIQVFSRSYDGKVGVKAGVRVGIFSDSVEYKNSKSDFDFSNADFSDSSDADGFVYFDKVQSNTRYYILCKYDSIYPKVNYDKLVWSNIDLNYQFLNPLKEHALTTANVVIYASEAFVNFRTTKLVSSDIIYVKLGSKIIDTIFGINDTVYKKVPVGLKKVIYTAKSKYGCAWVDEIELRAGISEIKNVDLPFCNTGFVKFGVGLNPNNGITDADFPFKIVLNNNDTLKTLIQKPLSFPFATNSTICNATNTVDMALPFGKYTYQFIGKDGSIMIGDFVVSEQAIANPCKSFIVVPK